LNNKLWHISHNAYIRGWNKVGRLTEILYNILCENSISTKTKIGGGTVFFHHGVGCVVHERSVIGDNCKIFSNVTIGCKWSGGTNVGLPPTIGNNVMIGAGAVILGDIHIGDNSVIGANSVVLKDIPANSMAVGAPARIIHKS
jgi:serine O-acetyltransferase